MSDSPPILRAWSPTPPPPSPPVLYVQVENCSEGVNIRLVDKKGMLVAQGNLLIIGANGIRRRNCVAPDFGLPLDDYSRVVLTEE